MAPRLLFDITDIDFNQTIRTTEDIEKVNPHRGAMRMVDRIVYEDLETRVAIAHKRIRDDEFWVEGHIPGRPIFPGVLMIEAAAQICSYYCLTELGDQAFMGFVGVDAVKFRGQVKPGDDLYILSKQVEMRKRRATSKTQGIVDGNLVFEATIQGMPM